MIILVDTNILIRLAEGNEARFEITKKAVDKLLSQNARLCVSLQNIIEFWVVATRPSSVNGLGFTHKQAESALQTLLEIFTEFPENQNITQEWKSLIRKHRVTGKNSHDARLVAWMNSYNITHILTYNTDDFKRYKHIKTINPILITT